MSETGGCFPGQAGHDSSLLLLLFLAFFCRLCLCGGMGRCLPCVFVLFTRHFLESARDAVLYGPIHLGHIHRSLGCYYPTNRPANLAYSYRCTRNTRAPTGPGQVRSNTPALVCPSAALLVLPPTYSRDDHPNCRPSPEIHITTQRLFCIGWAHYSQPAG